jgi:exosortase
MAFNCETGVDVDHRDPVNGPPVTTPRLRLPTFERLPGPQRLSAALAGLLALSIVWTFWPALVTMATRWSHDPRYSHGFLVPAFSAVLLWLRRDKLSAPTPSWWGLPLIAAGSALKLGGAYIYFEWLDQVAVLPTLAGLFLLVGGWPWLRWAWPAVAFLVFMVPMPYRVETTLGHPLQNVATVASTFALQTLGLPAVAEGNVILIDDARIGVVEACNGLGMLYMFFAIAAAVVFVLPLHTADKVVVLASVVPIALAANILRITVTGLLHETVGGGSADAFYHDMAGWLMMPVALGTLWAELYLLSHLLLEPPRAQAVPVSPAYVPLDGRAGRPAGLPRGRGGEGPAAPRGKTT